MVLREVRGYEMVVVVRKFEIDADELGDEVQRGGHNLHHLNLPFAVVDFHQFDVVSAQHKLEFGDGGCQTIGTGDVCRTCLHSINWLVIEFHRAVFRCVGRAFRRRLFNVLGFTVVAFENIHKFFGLLF